MLIRCGDAGKAYAYIGLDRGEDKMQISVYIKLGELELEVRVFYEPNDEYDRGVVWYPEQLFVIRRFAQGRVRQRMADISDILTDETFQQIVSDRAWKAWKGE